MKILDETFPVAPGVPPMDSGASIPAWLVHKMNRMTMIVGLVGTDGIVLAADRDRRKLAEKDGELDEVSGIKKIINLPDYGVAYAFAGDGEVLQACRALEQSLRDGIFNLNNAAASLGELARDFAQRYTGSIPSPRSILIAIYDNVRVDLWCVRLEINSMSTIERVVSREVCGAKGNSARYILDAYFEHDMPIEQLKRIAAHTVLSGYKVDRFINGLDVAVITCSGYQEVPAEERLLYRKQSSEIDRLITGTAISRIAC